MTIRHNYEAVTPDKVTREFTLTRLENPGLDESEPFAVVSLLPGLQITGTCLSIDGTRMVGDIGHGQVYRQAVRNVLTYNLGAEATWGPINEGDPIYFDRSATMPADCYLSTSPLDVAGTANPLWGWAVIAADGDTGLPVGGVVASTNVITVSQH